MSDTDKPEKTEWDHKDTVKHWKPDTTTPAPFPPRVWLRRVDVKDIADCGDGCEAEVHTLYSPRSIVVTSMDEYISADEVKHLLREALVRTARAEVYEEIADEFEKDTGGGVKFVGLREKAAEARKAGE